MTNFSEKLNPYIFSYVFHGVRLENVEKIKDLGVISDESLLALKICNDHWFRVCLKYLVTFLCRFIEYELNILNIFIKQIQKLLDLPNLNAGRDFLGLIFLYRMVNGIIKCPHIFTLSVPKVMLRNNGLFHIEYQCSENLPLQILCRLGNSVVKDIDFFNTRLGQFKYQ